MNAVKSNEEIISGIVEGLQAANEAIQSIAEKQHKPNEVKSLKLTQCQPPRGSAVHQKKNALSPL